MTDHSGVTHCIKTICHLISSQQDCTRRQPMESLRPTVFSFAHYLDRDNTLLQHPHPPVTFYARRVSTASCSHKVPYIAIPPTTRITSFNTFALYCCRFLSANTATTPTRFLPAFRILYPHVQQQPHFYSSVVGSFPSTNFYYTQPKKACCPPPHNEGWGGDPSPQEIHT